MAKPRNGDKTKPKPVGTLPDYLADVATELGRNSRRIARDFAKHRPSAGTNREDLVAKFLESHLPERFGVSSGLIISPTGQFSKEADVLIVDRLNNAPLYRNARSKLWPVEAVYALVEVKTQLTPTTIRDSMEKCQRFKSLPRRFCGSKGVHEDQHVQDSLFAIWAFESPALPKVKENLSLAMKHIPLAERPDLIVVPERFTARAGSYLELSTLGQPGSAFRGELQAKHPSVDLRTLLPEPLAMYDLSENSLLAWYIWIDSWLRRAGSRRCEPLQYLPPDAAFGQMVP